jgi:hypothetical protein
VVLWSKELIREAEGQLDRAAGLGSVGRFQLEAAIQSAHISRIVTGSTDWLAIVELHKCTPSTRANHRWPVGPCSRGKRSSRCPGRDQLARGSHRRTGCQLSTILGSTRGSASEVGKHRRITPSVRPSHRSLPRCGRSEVLNAEVSQFVVFSRDYSYSATARTMDALSRMWTSVVD